MVDFKHIDATAYAADQPLDTFLLVRNARNLEAVREHRGRSATYTPGTFDTTSGTLLLPEISAYQQRMFIPFFWHLTEHVTQITVSVMHQVATSEQPTAEVVVSAAVMPLLQFLEADTVPEGTTATLAGGATTPTRTELVIDVSAEPRGWLVVMVGFLSGEGSAVEITNSGGSAGPTQYNGFYATAHVLANTADLGTATAYKHWGLRVQTGTKVNTAIDPVQALLLDHAATRGTAERYFLHFWPPMPGQGVAGSIEGFSPVIVHNASTDALYYYPLGTLTLHSINITDTAVRQPTRSGRLDAGLPASVSRLALEAQQSHEAWRGITRMHHIGPQPSVDATDTDHTGTGPLNRIGTSTTLTTGFETICSTVVGKGDLYTYQGTDYTRTAITAKALVALLVPATQPGAVDALFNLTFRLKALALGTGGAAKLVTYNATDVPAILTPPQVWGLGGTRIGDLSADSGLYDDASALLGTQRPGQEWDTIAGHTLRGLIPEQGRLRRKLLEVELLFIDNTPAHATQAVQFDLECKPTDSETVTVGTGALQFTEDRFFTTEGVVGRHFPRLVLITWSVCSTPFNGRDPNPANIGI